MKPSVRWLVLLTLTTTHPALLVADDAVHLLEKNIQRLLPKQAIKTPTKELLSGQETLSLEDALAISLRDNLGLASKGAQLRNKQATASASFRKMLPALALNSKRSDIMRNTGGTDGVTYDSTMTLTQPLYKGDSLWSGWKSAEIQQTQAKLDLIHAARTMIKDVKAAWYGLLEKEALLLEAEESLKRLHQHESNAKSFFREGRMWRNEVLQAGVKVAQGEQALIGARNQVVLAMSELNRLMRRPLDHPLRAKGALVAVPMQWTLDEAYAHAREHRTDLEKVRLDVQVGELTETTTGAARLPTLDFSLAHNWNAQHMDYREKDSKTTALLSMNWTAWNWGETSSAIAAAKATTLKNQLTYDDQLQSVLFEIRKAFLTCQESALKIDVVKKSLQQAEENYRVNQIRYREQLGTATDVLNAMDLLTTTRNTYTLALSAYLTSMAALDLAAGKGAEDLEVMP